MRIENLQDYPKRPLGKAKDLTNKKFNMLTCLYRTTDYIKPSGNQCRWICQCDCGNYVIDTASHITGNHTKSCGCNQQNRKAQMLINQRKAKDLTGKVFGKLTALYPTKERRNNSIVWHCKCECGRECNKDAHSLQRGSVTSCGCVGSSLGENKIKEILLKNNIPFEQEKIFNSCRFEDTNAPARFDFYVNNAYIIEFDGQQHFTHRTGGWNTKEQFEKTISHDIFKNNWCKENNISLIRIPYTKLETLKIEDLLLETTKFLI